MGLPIECKLKLDDRYAKGRRNLITDVPGVKVGQITLNDWRKGYTHRSDSNLSSFGKSV